MSFLWGKKDEFEKDDNTIRGVYKLNPSSLFLNKTKLLPIMKFLSDLEDSESFIQYGGLCYTTNKTLNSFIEYFFGEKELSESFMQYGGMIYKNSVVLKDSFIEYNFFTYPYTGYLQESFIQKGDIAFVLEVTE